ncbi:hypothetical protein ES703_74873 [subsurface metagenome]
MKLTRLRILFPGPEKLAGESAAAHLNVNQVRLIFCLPHLNGVQVVAGSNPAAPTINNKASPSYQHSKYPPIFFPFDYNFCHSPLVSPIYHRIQSCLRPSPFSSQSGIIKVGGDTYED